MTRAQKRLLIISPLFAAIAFVSGYANAADAKDIELMSQAKITLTQAIDAAQTHQNGKAVEASLDDDSPSPVYEVSVVKDKQIYDVQIDGMDGKVLGSNLDR